MNDMRSLRELQAANITDTNTTNISNIQDTFLDTEVRKFAEALRFFRQVVEENDVLVNSRDKTLRIPKTTSHLTITTSHTEGAERTYTEMTNINTVDITPAFKLGAIAITKELVDTTRVDLIDLAKYMVAQDIEEGIEKAITEQIDTDVTTNVVYGGDATKPSELTSGDTITVDLVADAIQKVKENNYVPAFLFIRPAQENVFYKSSQFTNAAEYGSNEVVLNGEIGKYLGVKVITSTLTQHYSASGQDKGISGADGQWGAAGTSCQLIGFTAGKKKPIVLAWKQKPQVSYEYLKRYANHYIYYDAAYGVKVIEEKACCLIKVTDS
ncbi:MAG: hypothetical protein DRG33_01390 [Deltaproteobacteria bacterium]|nr:MAG: hypothetical protein DRG33_01390 [Deltaproteobacteria bacterium]